MEIKEGLTIKLHHEDGMEEKTFYSKINMPENYPFLVVKKGLVNGKVYSVTTLDKLIELGFIVTDTQFDGNETTITCKYIGKNTADIVSESSNNKLAQQNDTKTHALPGWAKKLIFVVVGLCALATLIVGIIKLDLMLIILGGIFTAISVIFVFLIPSKDISI